LDLARQIGTGDLVANRDPKLYGVDKQAGIQEYVSDISTSLDFLLDFGQILGVAGGVGILDPARQIGPGDLVDNRLA
jgi:hypothetical protein